LQIRKIAALTMEPSVLADIDDARAAPLIEVTLSAISSPDNVAAVLPLVCRAEGS